MATPVKGYPNPIAWTLANMQQAVADLAKERLDIVNVIGDDIVDRIAMLRQLYLHRMTDLAESSLLLCTDGQGLTAIVLIRASMEISVSISKLHLLALDYIKSGERKVITDYLEQALGGSKNKSTPFTSFNLLGSIDKIDKLFPGVRELYEHLCELSHPSYHSLMRFYSIPEKGTCNLLLGKGHRGMPVEQAIMCFGSSFGFFWIAYKSLEDQISQIDAIHSKPLRDMFLK